jgi:hypothetical protein
MNRKYHLQEQKIPDGFQIYDERLEVAGIPHRKDVAAQFVNQTDQWLEFESEPLNSYDSNAIKILIATKTRNLFGLNFRFLIQTIMKKYFENVFDTWCPPAYSDIRPTIEFAHFPFERGCC